MNFFKFLPKGRKGGAPLPLCPSPQPVIITTTYPTATTLWALPQLPRQISPPPLSPLKGNPVKDYIAT